MESFRGMRAVSLQCSTFPLKTAHSCGSMAMKFLLTLATLALAAAETVDSTLEALEADDSCAAGGDCSLELNQLRGMKDVNYHDALMEEDEDEEANVEGGACTNGKDLNFWKKGGRKSFDGSLNQCGRSCAAGFACTKSCMQAGL